MLYSSLSPDCAFLEQAGFVVKMGGLSFKQAIERIHSIIDQQELELECKEPVVPPRDSSDIREASGMQSDFSRNESIIKKEFPERVDHTTRWPHCVQGRLVAAIGDGSTLLGSGTMIGPNLVLTCAHNVYLRSQEKSFKIEIHDMTFYPCMNGVDTPYGGLSVLEVYYPKEFEDNDKEDYALLVLSERIGDYTGYFGIREYNRESLNNRKAHLYGYSAGMPGQSPAEHYLWVMEGSFEINPYNDMIDHTIDTSPGQTGSALYIEDDRKYYVIGVPINSTDSSRPTNQAVYLNEARINRIKGWVKDYDKKYSMIREIDSSKLENAYEVLMAIHDNGISLSSLSVLKLRDIKLKPEQASKLAQADLKSLMILDLSENSIGSEGAAVLSKANIINLKDLNLYKNLIKDAGATALSSANFPNLTTLNLSGNGILHEGAAALSRSNFPNLTTLDLSRNHVGGSGASAISQANFINIQTLNLSENSIGDGGAISLSQANFPKLQALSLSRNGIGDSGAIGLSHANFSNLTTLNLSYNGICYEWTAVLFPNLEHLDLSQNHIRYQRRLNLSQVNFINIKVLNLSGNEITDISDIAHANFPDLRVLDLANNDIRGISDITHAHFPNLRVLDLANNEISDIIDISHANFPSLTSLNLSGSYEYSRNQVRDEGAVAISQACFINLKSLYLSDCRIGDLGAIALSTANFPDLKELDLSKNIIGDDGASALSTSKFPYIDNFNLGDNLIGDEGKRKLRDKFTESKVKF